MTDLLIDLDDDTAPRVWMQWKGTDACFDFWCLCGAAGHFDGYFAYSVKCPKCGQVWALPRTLALVPIEATTEENRRWHTDNAVTVQTDESDG
jgi:hypothetical protein